MRLGSLDIARPSGKGDGFIMERRVPNSMNAGSPHWHPVIHCLCILQNVAGLWLKYGANFPKIAASLRRKNKLGDATIC
jgi:hypothetical protein